MPATIKPDNAPPHVLTLQEELKQSLAEYIKLRRDSGEEDGIIVADLEWALLSSLVDTHMDLLADQTDGKLSRKFIIPALLLLESAHRTLGQMAEMALEALVLRIANEPR